MPNRRTAFTLMEVLVSVLLISVVVGGILVIRRENNALMAFIDKRIAGELSNSLFLGPAVMSYNGKEKDALSLLRRSAISRTEPRRILREQTRTIHISAPLPVDPPSSPFILKAVMLKGDFSARYYRIKRKVPPAHKVR